MSNAFERRCPECGHLVFWRGKPAEAGKPDNPGPPESPGPPAWVDATEHDSRGARADVSVADCAAGLCSVTSCGGCAAVLSKSSWGPTGPSCACDEVAE